MAVVEYMGAYQQGQKLRKAKIEVGKLRVVVCLLIGQENENFFPNTRVRHGVHISLTVGNAFSGTQKMWKNH